MFPFSHLYLPITLMQDEPLFGYHQGEVIEVNLFEAPKSSELCVVASESGEYSIRRFESRNGIDMFWPPTQGTIRGTVVKKRTAPEQLVENQIA